MLETDTTVSGAGGRTKLTQTKAGGQVQLPAFSCPVIFSVVQEKCQTWLGLQLLVNGGGTQRGAGHRLGLSFSQRVAFPALLGPEKSKLLVDRGHGATKRFGCTAAVALVLIAPGSLVLAMAVLLAIAPFFLVPFLSGSSIAHRFPVGVTPVHIKHLLTMNG